MKKRLFLGGFAGLVGGMAMKAVVRFIDPDSFGLSTATDVKTAQEIARRMACEPLSRKRAAQIGGALHYGFAIGGGSMYAALLPKIPALRAGQGAAFGAVLWLVGDEAAVSASRLEDPLQVPIFSHCSAFAAHVLYGMVIDRVLSISRAI